MGVSLLRSWESSESIRKQVLNSIGFSMMRIIIMQISVAVIHVNGLLDLDNSAHHTMPHSIIAKSKDEQLLMVNWLLF